ncbi:AMP-binding protein [Mycobacterium sp. CBMA271]|uniref:carboxylic acid reductase n=1 Tax=unclassified Mycobacteroides TaxID=2618759 RepID=UPI0012DCF8AB|nr:MULTISPECIES: carboxylic acid reductase [unclassified Mycobacteroides]MUM20353.1 AMP-binding protein [Mycobacteroides sp. CBMA 271]
MPDVDVMDSLLAPGLRLSQVLHALLSGYADRPVMGFRSRESVVDPATGRTVDRLLPAFQTITYGQLLDDISAILAEWQHGANAIAPGDFIATIGFSSPDYVTVDLAALMNGSVSIPLQHNTSAALLRMMLEETSPRLVAASADSLELAIEAVLGLPDLRRVMVFDYRPDTDDHREKLAAARDRLHTAGMDVIVEPLAEVIARGRQLPEPTFYTDGDEQRTALIMYTSGSTGAPKGAMFTEWTVTRFWSSGAAPNRDTPIINVNFLPLNHLAGRVGLLTAFIPGGTCYFVPESDLSTLFEDWQLVRPTHMGVVPRVVDMLFQHYQTRMDALTAEGADTESADRTAKAELREEVLGGRVVAGMLATAPLSPEMKTFLESSLSFHLLDLYGLTEVGGVFRDGKISRPPVLDYKLVDVPELGYYTTDKPHPRGELLVKSATATPGYYKRPDVTAEVFDVDGYYRTGDVMAEIAPDELVYVDRRNNVIKLSQGEFVAVANLETVYVGAPLVRQIFVYGNSERAYLLAVVVPTDEALRTHPDPVDLKNTIRESLQRTARANHLHSYELPADFVIETTPFTIESGMLAAVGKPIRPKMIEHYGDRLERLYVDLAEARVAELRLLRDTAQQRPVIETVTEAAQALLGMSSDAVRPEDHFIDLGGDSLSALTFSNLLRDLFDVEVPVGVITGPAADLRKLAEYIATERESSTATAASVHGPDVSVIHAADLTLDKFIDAETLDAAALLEPPSGAVDTVLLTGANGYLGRFLCLEWLQRSAQSDGQLICLVRGDSDAEALARLEAAYGDTDPALLDQFRTLAQRHLRVIAADIAQPRFGVDDATWEQLAREVDKIVHPAALVNHVLPYNQLFQPNVFGTAEVIRLALTGRMKPVTYLSTMAVAMTVPDFDEDGDIRAVSPTRPVGAGYANGYANSKWAGEVLLREAHDLCGLPASVFRSDMILTHRRYSGQLNVTDAFTRMLLSLVLTGIAPRSFYQGDGNGSRPRAHYEGLPVDFVTEAITTLGLAATEGFRSYDVMNPHDDGISVDTFVDWLIEDGHYIDIIDDYDEWLSRFETALRGLPDEQRRASVLPLLDAYRAPAPPRRGASIPNDTFRKAVQEHEIGHCNDIPQIDRALITKYMSDLRAHRLL